MMLEQFNEGLKNNQILGEILACIEEGVYGVFYKNEIYLIREKCQGIYQVCEDTYTLERYITTNLNETKTYEEVIPNYEQYTEEVRTKIQEYVKDCECLRICSKCDKIMDEGYYHGGTGSYYCDDKCRDLDMTEDEYLADYEADEAYWTKWN